MAKGHKPVAGSRGYWPRKRAKRIYSGFKSHLSEDNPCVLDFAGYKAGMTRAIIIDNKKGSPTYGQEVVKPVTVLECPGLVVCGIRLYKRTTSGLKCAKQIWSQNLSKDLERKTKIPKKPSPNFQEIESKLSDYSDVRLLVHTKPRESGIGKKKPELFEIEIGGKDVKEKWEYAKKKLGSEIKITEFIKEGEYIDVKSVTKGKGFQGPVKRFGIKIRPRKHEKKRRHTGVLGVRNVARVLPGKIPMAGQTGYHTRTEFNKLVLKTGSDGLTPKGGWLGYGEVKGDYLVIEGSVPGPKKRLIMMRKGIRTKPKETFTLKKIILDSLQGK